MFRVTRYPMISKPESGRVGYRKKYRVAGRVRVPAGHCRVVDPLANLPRLLLPQCAAVNEALQHFLTLLLLVVVLLQTHLWLFQDLKRCCRDMKRPAADKQASDTGPPYFGASQPASIIPSAFLLCTLPIWRVECVCRVY